MLYKLLVQISQMFNLDRVWQKDDLIKFWGQKVKGQGRSKMFILEAY